MKTVKPETTPRALAMWDHTWIFRHYPGGDFESFEHVLDELVDRGYNAVRIEAFPHLIAPDPQGVTQDEFLFAINKFDAVLWGYEWSVVINPRRKLIEFLRACRERGVRAGLSGWLPDESLMDLPHDPQADNPNFFNAHPRDRVKRTDRFEGAQGLIHMWDSVFRLIQENDLLDTVLYCDILNEYPCCHGYAWLHNSLKTLTEPRLPGRDYNQRQVDFYNLFIQEVIKGLKTRWPQIELTASLTRVNHIPWTDVDIRGFDALDVHLWFSTNKVYLDYVGGNQSGIYMTGNIDRDLAAQYSQIRKFWKVNRTEMLAWMEGEVKLVADTARQHGQVCGNTEGWGSVGWYEHPSVDWKWIQECAEHGATLGARYGYAFNCTSNFTHPHFRRLWRDKEWHRHVTSIIKGATPPTSS